MRAAGYARHTGDLDLVVDAALENEAKVFDALATLPDKAVRELEPGDVAKYVVVRVADGVAIPFASPELLWRMKSRTHREKDRGDLQFLRMWFEARGITPPDR